MPARGPKLQPARHMGQPLRWRVGWNMTCDEVKEMIEQGIPAAAVEVRDLTGQLLAEVGEVLGKDVGHFSPLE